MRFPDRFAPGLNSDYKFSVPPGYESDPINAAKREDIERFNLCVQGGLKIWFTSEKGLEGTHNGRTLHVENDMFTGHVVYGGTMAHDAQLEASIANQYIITVGLANLPKDPSELL